MFRKLTLFISFNFLCICAAAQTTEFTYQGRLIDNGLPANVAHDFEFRLFAAETGGTPLGGIIESRSNVQISNGVFTVRLNFGSHFDGSPRWLEISVKPTTGSTFVTLTPRQPISSAPYSIKSLNSETSVTATNATQLGGVAANQYVITTDPRMTDARDPLPNSANYIQNNPPSQQSLSSFNVSGTGTANVFSATTQYNIGSNRILSTNGTDNLFAGVGAGGANASGERNSFFGAGAGQANTDGSFNAFFGSNAGLNNATGSLNAFFGRGAGFANIAGGDNAFFGTNAGANTTGSRNSFFGRSSGQGNIDGSDNVFVGMFAGNANSTGNNNTVIGTSADLGADNLSFATAIGAGSLVSSSNTIVLGRSGGLDTIQIPGSLNLGGAFSASILNASSEFQLNGLRMLSSQGVANTFVGQESGQGGEKNVFVGDFIAQANTGTDNTFVGAGAGELNQTGAANTFVGSEAGNTNTIGGTNTIIGYRADVGSNNLDNAAAIGAFARVTQNHSMVLGSIAGVNGASADTNVGIGTTAPNQRLHVVGSGLFTGSLTAGNQFNIGSNRILSNAGINNLFAGVGAGSANPSGANAFFGPNAGGNLANGSFNSIFGAFAGELGHVGNDNSFFGSFAGSASVGDDNSFFGTTAGRQNTTGSGNTIIGSAANVLTGNLTNATAIGYQAIVSQSNALILGSINGVGSCLPTTLCDSVNVGIGTTAPVAKLSVDANSSGPGDNTAYFRNPAIGPHISHVHFGTTGDWYIRSAASTGKIIMQDFSGAGEVRIGPSAPGGARLTVNTDVPNGTALRVQLANGQGTVASFGSGFFHVDDSGGTILGRFTIKEDGNVGIGNSNPQEKLNVNGNVALLLATAGSTQVCQNGLFRLSTCSSSLRYKQNINEFRSGVNLIKQLRPVTFDWKDTNKPDMGLVAEEVAEVEPLLATYNDKGEVEGVKYDRVGVVLINVVKEQQAQLEKQQEQIENLKKLVCEIKPTAKICTQ